MLSTTQLAIEQSQTTSWPLISVVITAYNYAHLLPEAIESVLGQDYPNLEVLILDDASTDNTPAVAQKFTVDARVHSIRHPQNLGSTANVNYGIQHSHGEYLMVLSADNRMGPQLLSRLYRSAQQRPDIDLHYGRNITRNAANGTVSVWDYVPVAYQGGRNEFAGLLSAGCYICVEATLVKRSIYERYGQIPDCCVATDLDLLIGWAEAGLTFAYVPEAEFTTLAHPGQASAPERYVATGHVVFDYLHWLDKYATTKNAGKLRGYEKGLIRTLQTLEATVRDAGYRDDGMLAASVQKMSTSLEMMRQYNLQQLHEGGISLLLLDRGDAAQLEHTLNSVLRQEYREWEVLILTDAGCCIRPDIAAVAQGRIKIVSVPSACIDTVALNIGLKLAQFQTLTFLQAGASLAAGDLSSRMATMQQQMAQICLTRPEDASADNCAPPNYPLHGITVRREAIDDCGGFNERLTMFYAWEFVGRHRKST